MEIFDELMFGAMDNTIKQVFGKSTSELIYRVAECHLRLKQEELGEKIEVFTAFFEKLLGSEKTQIIQATSMKLLFCRLQQEYEEVEKYFSFLDELYETKFKLLASSFREKKSVRN